MRCFLANFVFKVICRPLVLKRKTEKTTPTKAQCKGTGAERKKAGNMHEEPLSEKREEKRQMQKANQTGRFCHVASFSVLRVFPSSLLSPFFFPPPLRSLQPTYILYSLPIARVWNLCGPRLGTKTPIHPPGPSYSSA